MATNKEKALVRELVELCLEIGEQGVYDPHVDIRAGAVEFRICPKPFGDKSEWVFYGEETAYMPDETFDFEYFAKRIGVFIHEAKKHHSGYDADGIKLFGDEVAE